MAYTALTFVAFEVLTAAKMNQAGVNDAGFNDGSLLPSASLTSATVVTAETTTSTSAADLATTGPSVTVTIGGRLKALVSISMDGNLNGGGASLGLVVVSGANTISASTWETAGTWINFNGTTEDEKSYTRLLTGLSAGSTTFKLQYRVTAVTGTFKRRWISVIPY